MKKRRAIFDKHRCNADILILQETHSKPEFEKIWENEWGGKAIYSHGTSNSKGVAVFMSKDTFSKIKNVYRCLHGRIIIFDLEHDKDTLTIVALYAPNDDTPEFFGDVSKMLRDRSEHRIVIGDFNLVLDVNLDRLNTYCNNNRAAEEVENMMDEFCLRDVWRIQNGQERQYSWIKKGRFPKKASRIDLALVSGGLDQKVELVEYLGSIKTDHRALYVVVQLEAFQRGSGYWKFNTSLLQDMKFLKLMNQEIRQSLVSSTNKDPKQKWQILKQRIKNSTVKYSKERVSEDKLIIAQLSEKVQEYEASLPLSKEQDLLIEKTKDELEEKTMERIKGVMFRSKAKWYEYGEKNSKYFF